MKHSRPSDGRGSNRVARWIGGVCFSCISAAAVAILPACSSVLEAQQPAQGGDTWGLLQGAGTPVCEAYMARIADRPIDPRLPAEQIGANEMGVPDFGPVLGGYVSESMLLQNVADFLWERDANPANYAGVDAGDWRGTSEELASARTNFNSRLDSDIAYFGYRVARLDIDNDGTLDDAFYVGHYGGSSILLLETDRTTIDVDKTEKILKHPSRQSAGWGYVRSPLPEESVQRSRPVTDAYISARYNVLLYNGKFFVDVSWSAHPEFSVRAWNERATSKLYVTNGGSSEQICEFGRLIEQ